MQYFVNTSITATCMSVEVSHALQVCQWHAVCRWFSPSSPISATNKTDRSEKTEILLKMAINQAKNKRKLTPTLGCVMGPIFTSLSNDIVHVFSPVVSCPLQCSVRLSLLPFIVFLRLALSMFFLIISICSCYDSLSKWCSCCLIVTRRVPLVEQGLFSLSYHLNYHLDCSFFSV